MYTEDLKGGQAVPYIRKNPTKAEQVRKILEDARQKKAVADGSVKPRAREFQRPSGRVSLDRLHAWLAEFGREPLAYSALLQVWLDAHGFDWPKDLFTENLKSLGSGNVAKSTLGLKAKALHKPGEFGWMKVAKKLIPKEYAVNRTAATNKVRRAAENVSERVAPLESAARDTALALLGLRDPNDE